MSTWKRSEWNDSTETDLKEVILVGCEVDGNASVLRCGFCISDVKLSGSGKVGLLMSCSRRWYARDCLQSYDMLAKFHGNASVP
jgi:hypothetical protein